MGLTQTFVRKTDRPGRYGDGRYGLVLRVKPRADGGLAKTYEQQLRRPDRSTVSVGLGNVELVTLDDARARALDNARRFRNGEEIRRTHLAPKVPTRAVPTLRKFAEGFFKVKRSDWKTERTEKQWRQRLDSHAKSLMDMRIDAITREDVIDVLDGIRHMRDTANEVRKYVREIMDRAILKGLRKDNPSDDAVAKYLRSGQKSQSQHFAALPAREIGAALDKVEQAAGWPHIVLALRFIVLTASRSNEVRGMTWGEVDLASRTWEIPAERMKASRPHRVPLSTAAMDVLERAQALSDGSAYVFPSQSGKILSGNRLTEALLKCEVQGTVHGMRSSFRTWCAEVGVEHEVAEMCLAHAVGNKTVQAYQRSDLYMRRIAVMEQWAGVVNGDGPQAEVVPFPAAVANA